MKKGFTLLRLLFPVLGSVYISTRRNHGPPSTALILLSFSSLFTVQFLALLLYNNFIYPKYLSPLRDVPGPKDGNIFLGQTINLLKAEGPNDVQIKWMHENPDAPLIRYVVAGSEWLQVNSVQVAHDMLQTACYQFEKPGWFRRIVGEIAGIGLVNADGDVHRAQRRIWNGAFTLPNIKKTFPSIRDKAREFSVAIEDAVSKAPGEALEVNEMLIQTALDIIGRACLGVELNSLSTSSSTFHHMYQQIFHLPPVGQLIFVLNMFLPVRRWLPVKANRDFVHATTEVRRILLETIRKRKEEMLGKDGRISEEYSDEKRKDMDYLTYMVYQKGAGEDRWSDAEMHGHLLNFMSAGHETSAGAISWAILNLCIHPEIQTRLRDEIKTHIPHNDRPTYAELERLQYMGNFIKEVMRCLPSSVVVARSTINPTTLPSLPDLVIPAGTTMVINIGSFQLNPSLWGPDAHIFNPDRHDPSHPSAQSYPLSRDPYAIEAFSNGPRICIGKAFALLEIRCVLVELLRNWEMSRGWGVKGEKLPVGVEVDEELERKVRDGEPLEKKLFAGVKVQNFISLRPADGLFVRFKRIGDERV